jgi:hypothetical protein
MKYDVDFAESWLCNTVKNGSFLFQSIYNAYVEKAITSDYLQGDDPPIQDCTKDKNGKIIEGISRYAMTSFNESYFLTIVKAGLDVGGPSEFLEDFKGTLQINGYEGYNEIITRKDLIHGAA